MQTSHLTYPALRADPYKLIIGLGMLLMAASPIRWLATSWVDPAYDSQGLWVFGLFAAMLCWSLTSPRPLRSARDEKTACILLALTTLVRGIGQVLAVNVIGAGALVIDAYAAALFFGVKYRLRALSPGWLALLFAFSLPLERILQRVGGFGLQQASALGACTLLRGLFPGTTCSGVRILVENHDVLVDLPCSGARMLVLMCILYVALMALLRPRVTDAIVIGVVAVSGTFIANTLRITLLSSLVARPVFGIDAMAQPWHDMIGLFFLAATALPVILLAGKCSPYPEAQPSPMYARGRSRMTPAAALAFLVAAMIVVALPNKPVDAAVAPEAISLPVVINGAVGEPVLLTEKEKDYFTRFGGLAMKVAYGQNSVLLIQTSSPLRHLHAPDECLRGMGFKVKYAGMSYEPVPTATYLATAPDGRKWRVAVSFYADRNHYAANVAEAVWRWMAHRETWHALQRITPASLSDTDARRWDNAVFTALDLTPRHSQEIADAKAH